MVKESKFGVMVYSMMDNGLRTRLTGMENACGLMGRGMKANGKAIKRMVMVYKLGKMAEST